MNAMESRILAIFTRTPLHVGAGNSVGAIDSPVMRERHTGFPVIPGSSLKGVLADLWYDDMVQIERGKNLAWVRKPGSDAAWLFGQEEIRQDDQKTAMSFAGAILIGEARLLAFPMRSAKRGFAWVTCPLALARYSRDTGVVLDIPRELSTEDCYAAEKVVVNDKVILEEYCLAVKGLPRVADQLARLIDEAIWQTLPERLVIVSDEIFSYFVRNACEVVTRVKIDDEIGTVAGGALFNQENVPSETLFYTGIGAQPERGAPADKRRPPTDALEALAEKLNAGNNVLQIGGDETIGLGFCTVQLT
jgi:CRISPR-associated protein Cmr4